MARSSSIALVWIAAWVGSAVPSLADAAPEGPRRHTWTLRASISTTYEGGAIGTLPRRSMESGDFLLGVKDGTTYALGGLLTYTFPVSSDSGTVAFGLDLTAGRFQLGGDAFVGLPDSLSIESNDLCRATNVAIRLSAQLLTSDVLRRDTAWRAYLGGGGVILLSKLYNLSLDEVGSARIGVQSLRSEIGLGGGIEVEAGLRIARSRCVIGLRGAFIAGGAKLEVETDAGSRWSSGRARFGPETFGLFLGYSPR